jgi:hypothetical protein
MRFYDFYSLNNCFRGIALIKGPNLHIKCRQTACDSLPNQDIPLMDANWKVIDWRFVEALYEEAVNF